MKNKWNNLSVKELEAEIGLHNRLYFQKQAPTISDEDFDLLVETLRQKKPDSSILEALASDIRTAAKTIRHEVPMLSLDKCYDEKSLLKWADKFEWDVLATPKIDGCAVAIRYDSAGLLTLAATRGSGLEGEVITENVKQIADIPHKIDLADVEIRGEIYMPLSVFQDFSEEFANPRNLAAGAIKLKETSKTADYRLRFFAYDLLGTKATTEGEKRKWLAKNKFTLMEGKVVAKSEMQKIYEDFFARRGDFDFETDGVVFRVNEVVEAMEMGETAHHPRFAIAYKFQGDLGKTDLVDIIWSVSRSGTITPVGIVEPVLLSGASVTRVSLHNFGFVRKRGLTIPAKVLMVRRGGVIPKLEKVLIAKGKLVQPPKRCPSCGSKVEQREDFLYCSNPSRCSKSKIGEWNHFVKTVGIDGFGKKHLQQLYEKGLVGDPADFYRLEVGDLVNLERMGEKLAVKLVENIRGKRSIPLDIFLSALGIPSLGKHVAKILAQFGSLEKIMKITFDSSGGLTKIHTIGGKTAQSVQEGLHEKRPLIDRLLKVVRLEMGKETRQIEGPLLGKSFLFTGVLLAMKRSEAKTTVESLGGTASETLSKNLDYLVVGGGGGGGSKRSKVEKQIQDGAKTVILSEKEFLKIAERLPK